MCQQPHRVLYLHLQYRFYRNLAPMTLTHSYGELQSQHFWFKQSGVCSCYHSQSIYYMASTYYNFLLLYLLTAAFSSSAFSLPQACPQAPSSPSFPSPFPLTPSLFTPWRILRLLLTWRSSLRFLQRGTGPRYRALGSTLMSGLSVCYPG